MKILGIDPGSQHTGYGCIVQENHQITHLAHGVIHLNTTKKTPHADRLLNIFHELSSLIQRLSPEVMVIEKVFFAKNALSALKLGEARGAAVLTGKISSLQIAEYSATEVKLAVVGHGQAPKEAVSKMIQWILGPQVFSTFDESDALALALCHAYKHRNPLKGHTL